MNVDTDPLFFSKLPFPGSSDCLPRFRKFNRIEIAFLTLPDFPEKKFPAHNRSFWRKNVQVFFARYGVNPVLSTGRTTVTDRTLPEPFESGGRKINAEWFEFQK
jgi:hypothetical protein